MASGQGRKLDARLEPLKQHAAAGSDEAGGYSDPHGGFLVPEGFAPSLLQLQPEDDPIAGRTRPFPMSNPVVQIPARVDKDHTSSVSGGLTVTRRPETVAGTSSRATYERVTLRATSLFGLSYATEEIMTDSPISFIALLSSSFNQEFGAKGVDERLNGTGVGEPEGILNSPALVSVAKQAGQTADTINYENIKKMRSRCWGYGRAIWLANHDTMPDLMSLVQVVGTGGAPVYQPSAQEDRPDLMLGRPIFYTEYCKTIGDVGDLVLANWFEYLDATYQPLQSAESMHVRFVEHERAFKFWLRNDGRGWWRSALTPKNSSQTLSPFVALAARA
jgi:HK97 family phage major capsid protein